MGVKDIKYEIPMVDIEMVHMDMVDMDMVDGHGHDGHGQIRKFKTIDPNCETHPSPQFHKFRTFTVNLAKIFGQFHRIGTFTVNLQDFFSPKKGLNVLEYICWKNINIYSNIT